MGTQSNKHDVEIIDLTDDTVRHDVTITINDSFAPESEARCSEDNNNNDADIDIFHHEPAPSPSPILLSGYINCSDSPSSSLPSRLPSSASLPSSHVSTPISTPSPDIIQIPKRKSPRVKAAILNKQSNKQMREELKRQKLKQKEEEKLQKEANRANAANKALNNCTANIDVNIPEIINDPDEISLKTLFDESMVNYRLTKYPKVENSIMWTYKRTEVVDGECVLAYKNLDWIIIVMPGSEYLKKLLAYKASPEDSQSIKTYLLDARRRSQADIVLIVYNLANHLKSERAKDAKNYRKTFKDRYEKTSGEFGESLDDIINITSIRPTDLQDTRLMFEVEFRRQYPEWKLHIEFHDKTIDVVQSFTRYTISMARRENKLKTRASTGLDWAINMDKERAVDPAKSREDLTRLWVTQLQQFSQITLPIAKAIAAEYPSPLALLDQYKNLTTSEAEELLAELYVQKNLRRQIGSNISKRIHRFMTCRDPDVHLGLC